MQRRSQLDKSRRRGKIGRTSFLDVLSASLLSLRTPGKLNARKGGTARSLSPTGFTMTDYIKYYALRITYLAYKTNYLCNNCDITFLNYVYPNPPCQLSLIVGGLEESGAPGENPQLSAER